MNTSSFSNLSFFGLPTVGLLCLLLAFPFTVQAQVSGYQGKRSLFKVNMSSLLLEKGFGAEAEIVLSRELSASISYQSNQEIFEPQYLLLFDSLDISRQMLGITIKKYFISSIVAPKGPYYVISYHRGVANLGAVRVQERSGDFPRHDEFYRLETRINNAIYDRLEWGFGHQWIIGSLVTLDIRFVIVNDVHSLPGQPIEVLRRFPMSSGNLPFTRQEYRPLGTGFTLNVGLGILLF